MNETTLSVLVQDAACMVVVPNIAPDTPPPRRNPVFLYFEDRFQRPNPFRPDVAVAVDSVVETKVRALDAHVSQMHEWLPWVAGQLDQAPADPRARLERLRRLYAPPLSAPVREALRRRYGTQADSIQSAEAFELCEYGRPSTIEELDRLFPR